MNHIEAMKQALVVEAALQSDSHPSKDARWFAQMVLDYFKAIAEAKKQEPKREWVELTDEDMQVLAAQQHDWESLCFAVEAKLKEKNT